MVDIFRQSQSSPSEGHRTLIDNVPNGILVLFDAELRYRIVGPDPFPFTDRRANDIVGKTIFELFEESFYQNLEPELTATIDGDRRSFDIEFTDRTLHIETKPVTIDEQQYGVLLAQDVTENREMAQELERTNERLDQFASMLGHDLRNPLTIALGNLELYRETGDEAHLNELETALDRIDELTQDLYSLAQTASTDGDFESVSLGAVAKSAWDMVDTRSATLKTEDATITGSEGQLITLFENLFRNAVSHGGDDITVRVGPLSDGFFVEDSGIGISREKREEVFKHGCSTLDKGSGVGLTIVSRIADAHGLDIALTESSDGGARFEFEKTVSTSR